MVEVEEYITFNTCGFRPKVQNANFLKILRKPLKDPLLCKKKKEYRLERLYGHFPCDHFEPS